jgi:hypothetical protein
MEFGIIIPNIMEGEVVIHLGDPPNWVRSIKFMHLHFWKLIPGVWRIPREVGIMSSLIMRRMRGFIVVLQVLTLVKKSKVLGNGLQVVLYVIHFFKALLELVKVPRNYLSSETYLDSWLTLGSYSSPI